MLASVAATAQAPGDVRVALVIGNSAYDAFPALVNPVNDATAMSATLKTLGFTVVELRDGSRQQMSDAVARVHDSLKGRQGIGMLYYAGHGLQLDFRNYMVPVDARLASASDVAGQTLDVGRIIDAFKTAGNRMNIVVLDACRDNPFSEKASGKGLAPLDAPSGTFLAYATAPGNVAEDGDALTGNGLYTGYLVKELQKPAARIEDVFKRVRLQVRQQSKGRQIPWESTSLEEDFYFSKAQVKALPRPGSKEDDALFELERSAWDRIKDAGKPEDFYAFLQLFPSGRFSEQANFRLNLKEKPVVVAAPTRDQAASLASQPLLAGRGAERFKVGDKFAFVIRDPFSGAVTGRYSFEARGVSADAITPADESTPLRLDAMGAVSRDDLGTYEPPRVVLPAEYAVGKTWEGRTQWAPPSWPPGLLSFKSRVVRREAVTTPAGTFDAWYIETRGSHLRTHSGGQSNAVVIKTWAVSHLGVPVRQELVSRSPFNSVAQARIIELERLDLAR